MIKLRIVFLTILLLVPALLVSAQTATRTADKSWNAFWSKFTLAVNSKNKAAIRKLTVPVKNFSSGSGVDTRDQWLASLDREKSWRALQKTISAGTKPFNEADGKPTRLTLDETLIFKFIGGRWQFKGLMGD